MNLDLTIVRELEAGSRMWTMAELEAFAEALGQPLSTIFATWDDPKPAGRQRGGPLS